MAEGCVVCDMQYAMCDTWQFKITQRGYFCKDSVNYCMGYTRYYPILISSNMPLLIIITAMAARNMLMTLENPFAPFSPNIFIIASDLLNASQTMKRFMSIEKSAGR